MNTCVLNEGDLGADEGDASMQGDETFDSEEYGDEVDEEGLQEDHYLEQGTDWDPEAEDQEDEYDDEEEDDDDHEDIFVGQVDPLSLLDVCGPNPSCDLHDTLE
jgi:hypothetical protein